VRMFPYPDARAALVDALRLSEAMTLKTAFVELPLGGGKSVIWGDPRREKSEALLRAFAERVDRLAGRYYCAEDVGTRPADMAVIGRETPFVTGRPGHSGDTCPSTALGVLQALRAAVRIRLGRDDLVGLRVALQGCGGVGSDLAKRLHEEGAKLWIADRAPEAAERARGACGAEIVAPEVVAELDVDVFAPCALGGVLNADSIPRIRAAIICGAANNQLAPGTQAEQLAARGILYVPDFVANAGGVVSAASELTGEPREGVRERVEAIYGRCLELLEQALREEVAPLLVARRRVDEILSGARSSEQAERTGARLH